MNKQFDVFVKMKITEMSKTIHDMTYTYINPETKKPTDVPAKHYQDILKQPVEVMVEEQVKKQFLNIMFKQLKNLKEEEPHLFYQSLLLMDIKLNFLSQQQSLYLMLLKWNIFLTELQTRYF